MIKLIKSAQLHYPGHKSDKQTLDLLIVDGTIKQIDKNIVSSDADEVISGDNLVLFPGLVDMQCSIGEPGDEDKEDFASASKSAHAGGFTDIVMLPTTNPVIDSKSTLSGIKNEVKNLRTQIHAFGALSKNCDGSELSEMFDLAKTGAIGFSDGKNPVKDSNMMKRALEYAKGFDGLVCSFPLDERINPGGMVNESPDNLTLGLKPSPSLAEEIMVVRDLYLAEYTNTGIHFSTVSTAKSVTLIREAKTKGIKVTCGVALPNLLFTEQQLSSFDSNYKTMPPLRSEKDRLALIEGVLDRTIDVIVTDHSPAVVENKNREFDYASYGMTMLETALSMINTELPELKWETFVEAMSIAPRNILKLSLPRLEVGADYNFTLFDTKKSWSYDNETKQSKASNSPMFNKQLVGKAISVVK